MTRTFTPCIHRHLELTPPPSSRIRQVPSSYPARVSYPPAHFHRASVDPLPFPPFWVQQRTTCRSPSLLGAAQKTFLCTPNQAITSRCFLASRTGLPCAAIQRCRMNVSVYLFLSDKAGLEELTRCGLGWAKEESAHGIKDWFLRFSA